MSDIDDSVQLSLTPDEETALKETLGYLNFSSGASDSRFQSNLDRLHRWFAPLDGRPRVARLLQERLHALAAGSPAFQNSEQASGVLSLVFDHVLPAYRAHHADLLFHLAPEDFFQPFFVARVIEGVLLQGAPWGEIDRITTGALKHLNDFLGHRPVAVLETGQQMQPYAHERFRPVPLFVKGAGVATGRYRELVAGALEILAQIPPDILSAAYFDMSLLDELSLDVRAYDHAHPVYKRTNYTFGEWDPHCLDVSGRYRRFVVRAVILDALRDWISQAHDVPADEQVREASAVLAGTMLMASSVSGSGPDTHDSNVSLTSLLPKIARQRDAFYARLLQTMKGKHADRLRREALVKQQPFGAIRQHLNLYLANYGCRQMQRAHLAYLFARMGFAEAAREQAAIIPAAATRFETEIQLRMTLVQFDLDRGEITGADRRVAEVEEYLHRGIDCGAIVDPWNILGFQGQFPLFTAREDSVADPRVDKLLIVMEQIFNIYSRLVCEAAAAGEGALCQAMSLRFRQMAEFWDKFATTTVSDLVPVFGRDSYESAVRVTQALAAWHREGESAGDIAFWKRHVDEFQSPRAYAIVVDLLLRKKDALAAMNLLIQWLSQSQTVALEAGAYSFFPLLMGWLNLVLARTTSNGEDPANWTLIKKFFDYLEVNAGEWGMVPRLKKGAAGELKLGGGPADRPRSSASAAAQEDSGPESFADEDDLFADREQADDESETLYGAAYENVVFRDSAQDGHMGDTLDESSAQHETDLDLIAAPLEARMRFLVTLSQAWGLVAEVLWGHPQKPGARWPGAARLAQSPAGEQMESLRHWEDKNDAWLADLGGLMEDLAGWDPMEPEGDPDSLGEYDRQLHVKFGIVNSVISAGVALSDTARTMNCLLRESPRKQRHRDFDMHALAVLRCLAEADVDGVRRALPAVLRDLARRPLLYVPVDRGGRPKDILVARSLQSLIRTLLSQLPQLGLFRETWHVLRTAYVMERTSPPNGMSITEFDRLLEAALQSTLAVMVSSTTDNKGRPLSDDALVELTAKLLEVYLRLWLKHSATMRLSSVEGIKDPATWRKVKSFIKKYGGDLFHPRMLSMGNLRGIVQRGAEAYLDYLSENEDPLHPVKLLEDIDRTISRGEAAFLLETILRCIVEKFDRFLEYNTTTTQSDYGEQLHCLLDFLRHEAEYERQAWNLAPMELAHEALSRLGRSSAADRWRIDLARKTAAMAKNYLTKLKRLETRYGMRLPGVSDRLSEKFVKPLALDRILALVKPAMRDSRRGVASADFQRLKAETEEYLSTTLGSALELQPWLQTLEEEVQQTEADALLPSESGLADGSSAARVPIRLDEIHRQLTVWEKPLEEAKPNPD
jgi:hypothetical protein